MIDFIKEIIISPPLWLKTWLKSCFCQFIKLPCRYLTLGIVSTMFIGAVLFWFKWGGAIEPLLFYHQNYRVIKAIDNNVIHNIMSESLKTMGKGATISKITIGFLNPTDQKKSIAFEEVFSCVHNKKTCLVDSKLNHPTWYKTSFLDKRDVNTLEKDTLVIYSDYLQETINMDFQENSPICIKIYNYNSEQSYQFLTLKNAFPALSTKLLKLSDHLSKEKANSYIHHACFTKIRHPAYKDVILLFLFTFWSYGGEKPQMLNYQNAKSLLRSIADQEKQFLFKKIYQ